MIKFDRNIPYNDLPELPPPAALIDKEILNQWGLASRALAELNRNIMRMPNPSMLVNTISLQESKSSSEIENIITTDDELYKAISDSARESISNSATKEVLRYREALWMGFNIVKKDGKIEVKTIVKIFREVKHSLQGIRSEQSQVVIKRGQSEYKPGEIIYTPPRGKGIVEQKMKHLISFMNDPVLYPMDPLLKMVIGHYQFEAIHPFTDGNGRIGRILNLIYLIQQGLLSHPVLFLSRYILANKDDYYATLGGVTMRRAWKPWILFMLNAVEKTAHSTNQTIDEILEQMESTLIYAKSKFKWYNIELNQLLFSQPYIKPKKIGEVLDISSRTTITKYVHQLRDSGILSEHREGKEVFYLNNDLMRILKS